VGWIKAAVDRCSDLNANDVDIILASGPSFSAFVIAQRLAERLRCPYVLDYRDLWSQNLHHPVPLAVRKEASVLAGGAAVTTVSRSWGLVLDRQFAIGPKVHVVSNGYDREELANITPRDFGHFAVVYTGIFYPPKRVISPVMAALRRLNDNGARRWMFHYYGRHESHVWEAAERFRMKSSVAVHGNVPRSEALAAVKGAGVAVVITSVAKEATLEDNGMVTGKLFEAIGLGTPVLLIAPTGSDARIVAETTGLAHSFTADDLDGIAAFLGMLVDRKTLEPKEPEAYAWENLIGGLDRLLREAIGG
jgi:glycosyltransferase involved in cell wall biosynthesis